MGHNYSGGITSKTHLFGVKNHKRASGKLSFHAFITVTAGWTAVLRMLVGMPDLSAGSSERRSSVAGNPSHCQKAGIPACLGLD